jgi:hypothetical protein
MATSHLPTPEPEPVKTSHLPTPGPDGHEGQVPQASSNEDAPTEALAERILGTDDTKEILGIQDGDDVSKKRERFIVRAYQFVSSGDEKWDEVTASM